MLKRILRAALGVIFFFVFFLFLLAGALKFRILSAGFWKTALERGNVYVQLQNQVGATVSKMREDVQRQAGGRQLPAQFVMLLSLDKELTADRFQKLLETNVDRIMVYVNGGKEGLKLFLPVREWNLPVAAFGPGLANLTGETPVETALTILGMKQEAAGQILSTVELFRSLGGALTIIFVVSFLVVAGILAGHFFLGEGLADRISGTAWVLMISGFVAKLVGVGAGGLFELIAKNSKPPMAPWAMELGRSLVGQFFNLGATIGLVAGLVGLGAVIAVIILTKQGKIKEEKEKIGFFKRALAFVLGVTAGLVLVATATALSVVAFGGKVNFKVGAGGTQVGVETVGAGKGGEKMALAETLYESKNGWAMKQPVGWEYIADEASDGFLKRPSGSATDWASMEIKTVPRTKFVDEGTWIATFKAAFEAGKLGLTNAKLVEEPKETAERGMKRFDFLLDHDQTISQATMRTRLWRVEFYPVSGGDGFAINARVPADSWDTYSDIIGKAIGTLEIR